MLNIFLFDFSNKVYQQPNMLLLRNILKLTIPLTLIVFIYEFVTFLLQIILSYN